MRVSIVPTGRRVSLRAWLLSFCPSGTGPLSARIPGTAYLATIIKSLRDTNRFALPTLEDRFPFLEERPDSFLVVLAVVDSAAYRLNPLESLSTKGESMC